MSERIEEYIQDNLRAFDNIESINAEEFWNEYSRSDASPLKLKMWYLALVSLIVFAVLGYLWTSNKEVVHDEYYAMPQLEKEDPQLADYQMSMIESIAASQTVINSKEIDKKNYEEIYTELENLDKEIKQHQRELESYGYNSDIIKSILRCTKLKVRLYEILLFEIELNVHYEDIDQKQAIIL